MKTIYLVKDLARTTGHTIYTVEHYLKEGLLTECGRGPHTRYRYFDESSVEKLRQIRQFRQEGKSLKEIRSLIG